MIKFSIGKLRQIHVVEETSIVTTIQPSEEYLKKLPKERVVAHMYPEDAYIKGEDEEDDYDEDDYEDDIFGEDYEIINSSVSVDQSKLIGYFIAFPDIVISKKMYCLMICLPEFTYPLAYSESKKQLEIFKNSLDLDITACRVSLLVKDKKNKDKIFKNEKDLLKNYLWSPEDVSIEKQLCRDYKEDMLEIQREEGDRKDD